MSNYHVNISTGQVANHDVQSHLTAVKETGQAALDNTIKGNQDNISKVKLNTFHTQNNKAKNSKKQAQGMSKEVTALLRITQITASGGDVDITDFIGQHECADFSPSLFDDYNSKMRSTESKSSLVKAPEAETEVKPSELPESSLSTSDAMFDIRK